MRYSEFRLIEGYREVAQKFSQTADSKEVDKFINVYRDLVNRNQVQGNERNIDWWGRQGWENFARFVQAKSQQKSQTQIKRRKEVGQSYTIDENDRWLIVVPLDKDASCFHGRNTDWCTTKPQHDYFEKYFINDNVTLIYFLQKQTGAKWAMAVYDNGKAEYFDKNDNSLDQQTFDQQTGLNSEQYKTRVANSAEAGQRANAARDAMKQDQRDLEDIVNQFTAIRYAKRNIEIETLLQKSKNTKLLRNYVSHLVGSNGEKPIEFDQSMQNTIVNQAPGLIKYISNISDRTAKAAVKQSSDLIKYIPNPSPEIMLLAVEENPFVLDRIDNPTPEAIDRAIEITPYAIHNLNGQFTTDQLIKATDRFLNMPEDDGGPNRKNGVPLISEVTQWLMTFNNKNVEITDYKFFRWLVDNYEYGANVVFAYFLMSGKILNNKIAQELKKEHSYKFDLIGDLPVK